MRQQSFQILPHCSLLKALATVFLCEKQLNFQTPRHMVAAGGVRFGSQTAGALAQTIRPARRKAAGGSDTSDLDLPQGEPMSPKSSGNSSEDEEGGNAEGSDDEERQEAFGQHTANQTGKLLPSYILRSAATRWTYPCGQCLDNILAWAATKCWHCGGQFRVRCLGT
jgi:hypothetical protein